MIKSINIFSFVHNCKQCFEADKLVDLDKTTNPMHFNRQPEFVVRMCDKIIGSIKNSHFSFYDFKIYVFMLYLFKNKVNFRDININDIVGVKEKCTNKRFEKDGMFIDGLLKKVNLDISDLWLVNSNGNNILLDLILEGKISPIYYVLTYKPFDYDSAKYDVSDDLKLINRRTETIKNILRR